MKKCSLIVAVDKENGIGFDNALPWRLPGDMKHFVRKTTGEGFNAIIMGRKTWDSLNFFAPLKNRHNIIISRKHFDQLAFLISGEQPPMPNPQWARSFKGGWKLASIASGEKGSIFIIGGSSIYQLAIECGAVDFLYLTRVHHTYRCDRFFPWDDKKFKPYQPENWKSENHNGLQYTFEQYTLTA